MLQNRRACTEMCPKARNMLFPHSKKSGEDAVWRRCQIVAMRKNSSCWSCGGRSALKLLLENFFDPSRTRTVCPGSLTNQWHLSTEDTSCWCAGSWSLPTFCSFMCIGLICTITVYSSWWWMRWLSKKAIWYTCHVLSHRPLSVSVMLSCCFLLFLFCVPCLSSVQGFLNNSNTQHHSRR